MSPVRSEEVERTAGRGQIYKETECICDVDYQIIVYQEIHQIPGSIVSSGPEH
jgi:hypothetical protein